MLDRHSCKSIYDDINTKPLTHQIPLSTNIRTCRMEIQSILHTGIVYWFSRMNINKELSISSLLKIKTLKLYYITKTNINILINNYWWCMLLMTDFQGNIKESILQKVKKPGDILLYGLYLGVCGPKGYIVFQPFWS